MPVTISVSGTSELSRDPEQAVLQVEARHECDTKDAAISAVVKAAALVVAELKTLPTSKLASWKSRGLQTRKHNLWNEKTQRNDVVRHHSSQSITATFSDFEALNQFVAKFASHEHLELNNVSWTLTKATLISLQCESRQEAVREALLKAKHYAGALGLEKVECLDIADPETGSTFSAPVAELSFASGVPRMLKAVAFANEAHEFSAEEEEAIQVTPEQVTITANVHARFTAS